MNLTGWKTFQQYLEENEQGRAWNRAKILSSIDPKYRQQIAGRWWISPKCPMLKQLGKGTPDPRHPVGAPRKTTNGKDAK